MNFKLCSVYLISETYIQNTPDGQKNKENKLFYHFNYHFDIRKMRKLFFASVVYNILLYIPAQKKIENGYTFAPLGKKNVPIFYIKVYIKYKQNK